MPLQDPAWLARSSDAVKQIYRYWRSKCEGDRLPKRSAIDPVEIPRFLPQITIVEVVPDERRYVYRLVGTKEVEIRGRDPTGRSVTEGFFGPSLDDALSCYDTVVKTRAPHYDDTPYITPDGRYSDDETLFLPLSEDEQNVTRILVFGTFSPGPKP
ncbi:MAG TPA: PAS domain-containing protein [Dongiaceae bacterium]|jgi:hypothetical protein|nr:PAS domain-containing protein [Dongiaceae bacterium]